MKEMNNKDQEIFIEPAKKIIKVERMIITNGDFLGAISLENKPANAKAMAYNNPSTLVVGKYNQMGQ